MTARESLPTDLAAAHALILAERAARVEAEARLADARAEAASAQADLSSTEAFISHLKLEIEKLRRQLYGTRSERKARLLEQMELQLEELEAAATEDELAAEKAAARAQSVQSFQRRRPARKPFADHLPRERVVIPAPESCPCCGSKKLSKLGEDVTETLEVIPRQWKVIQTVREKFSCRTCETITQPPAPFHVTPRGFAGPQLLAMILFEKFGQHQPLNRQSERYRREGVDLSLSTLADQVGACATVLQPLHELIERHVLAAERLHGDDTTVPILAKGKTIKGHIWTYVRDDRPFGGRAPPAALFYASRDRRHEHPTRHLHGFTGILQADAYSGYNELCDPSRAQGPITAALCWAHARRQFFELADIAANARRGKNAAAISPIALEAVKRIDALFDIERGINGQSAEQRLRVRQEQSAPLVAALQAWLREQRSRLSRSSSVAEPIDYMLRRWGRFARFIDDGRICLTNNAAERALRGFALGRKSWLFAGSERGADRAAIMATLIVTAKLNDIDPQAWLAEVLARIANHTIHRLDELLPWNWAAEMERRKLGGMTVGIARLKITLDHVKPAVLRCVEVPFDIKLDRLHLTIQAAMGWTNSHLYELRAGDVGWSTPDPFAGWEGDFLDARKARLDDILEDAGTKKLAYLYDFGDGWEHTIKIERLIDPEPGVLYPRLIEVRGRCPPEDCDGPWGYSELLEVLGAPKHERHAELTEWIGDDFDPNADQAEWLTAEVRTLAKKWSRKSLGKRTRPR